MHFHMMLQAYFVRMKVGQFVPKAQCSSVEAPVGPKTDPNWCKRQSISSVEYWSLFDFCELEAQRCVALPSFSGDMLRALRSFPGILLA